MKRKAYDWDYCSECRYQSTRKYCASDKEYDHGQLTNLNLDGSSILIDSGYLDSD